MVLSWTPVRYHLSRPIRLFASVDDGISFHSFWTKIDEYEPTILVIRTTKKEVDFSERTIG